MGRFFKNVKHSMAALVVGMISAGFALFGGVNALLKGNYDVAALFVAPLLALVSVFIEFDKQLATSRDETEKERIRLKEHNDLLEKSNGIQRTSNEVVLTQMALLSSQEKIINDQIEQHKQLVGGDGVPQVQLVISDTMNSPSKAYEVRFFVENRDSYPIYGVEATINDQYSGIRKLTRAQSEFQGSEIDQEIAWKQKLSAVWNARHGPSILKPGDKRELLLTVLEFGQGAPYQILIEWFKGSYELEIGIKQDERNVPFVTKLMVTENGISQNLLGDGKHYITFLLRKRPESLTKVSGTGITPYTMVVESKTSPPEYVPIDHLIEAK